MARILIVDDEPDMRLAVRNVLKLRGYDITEAGDGPSALELARKERPDLVLLDMRLPGMDGIEVLSGLKKIDGSLPVVMITGYGHIQSAVDVMKLGASEYLQKPFENAQLVETVKRFARGGAVPPKRSYKVQPRELPEADETPLTPAPAPAAAARPAARPRRALAAVGLAALLAFAALYGYMASVADGYYKEYPGVAPNISALMWKDGKLVAGDWLARAVYVYAQEKDGLKLERTYQLDKTHISGLAAAGDVLYVADSWRKVVEARSFTAGLPVLKVYPMPGNVAALFYDGEYLWTCDGEGNAVLRRADSELTPSASFRLPEKPDQIFKDSKYLWTAVSSTGRIYRHKLDDGLTQDAVFSLKTSRPANPLSAFAWKGKRLWLARDGLGVLTETGKGELVKE
jgi:CheY-like chemotaxis protein